MKTSPREQFEVKRFGFVTYGVSYYLHHIPQKEHSIFRSKPTPFTSRGIRGKNTIGYTIYVEQHIAFIFYQVSYNTKDSDMFLNKPSEGISLRRNMSLSYFNPYAKRYMLHRNYCIAYGVLTTLFAIDLVVFRNYPNSCSGPYASA